MAFATFAGSSPPWSLQALDANFSLLSAPDGVPLIGLGAGSISNNLSAGSLSLRSNTSGGALTAYGFNSLNANISGNDNTAIGANTLKLNTTGNGCTAVGSGALKAQTTGTVNDAYGQNAGGSLTTGFQNLFVGLSAGTLITDGTSNVFVGQQAGQTNIHGTQNTFVGYQSGNLNLGDNNTYIGQTAGWTNSTGSRNISIGRRAGFYAVASDELYIDNQDRGNSAGDKANAIIFGTMAAAAVNQRLQINAVVTKSVQPEFLATATLTTNVTGDATVVTVIWGTKIFDLHTDFASNTFTAPVAGKYHFDVLLSANGLAVGNTLFLVSLVCTSRTLTLSQCNPSVMIGSGELAVSGGADVDMAAGDTATVTFRADGTGKAVGYKANSHFSGHLVA